MAPNSRQIVCAVRNAVATCNLVSLVVQLNTHGNVAWQPTPRTFVHLYKASVANRVVVARGRQRSQAALGLPHFDMNRSSQEAVCNGCCILMTQSKRFCLSQQIVAAMRMNESQFYGKPLSRVFKLLCSLHACNARMLSAMHAMHNNM